MPRAGPKKSNHHVYSHKSFSYDTCIREQSSHGLLVNITKYSVTTSKHQSAERFPGWAIKLRNVPVDTFSLAMLYEERLYISKSNPNYDPILGEGFMKNG